MPRASPASPPPAIAIDDAGARVAVKGALGIRTLPDFEASLKQHPPKGKSRTLDLSGLTELDTPGALFLCALRELGMTLTGVRAEHRALLDVQLYVTDRVLEPAAGVQHPVELDPVRGHGFGRRHPLGVP